MENTLGPKLSTEALFIIGQIGSHLKVQKGLEVELIQVYALEEYYAITRYLGYEDNGVTWKMFME